jgi:hypothetical protein
MRSPRTPPTSNEPHLFFVAPNRKSTDSWNSSNQDYELDSDWKPDHLLLLSRVCLFLFSQFILFLILFKTLDALPAHLLTPFNGSVPPSNLLDKIARGVANAKGPIDWPHSIRATRVKLMELARLRAKESAPIENRRRHRIPHEDDYPYPGGEVLQQSTNTLSRRPLYRQSSMDFLNTAKVDNDNIARFVPFIISSVPRLDSFFLVFQLVFNAQIDSSQIPLIIPILVPLCPDHLPPTTPGLTHPTISPLPHRAHQLSTPLFHPHQLLVPVPLAAQRPLFPIRPIRIFALCQQ